MKDTSFKKLISLGKFKDLIDYKGLEVPISVFATLFVEIILLIWNRHETLNKILSALDSTITGIGFAMIGFLGFVVTGLAILTGAISSKIVKRLKVRKKMNALERILLSFYLLGFVCAMVILCSLIFHLFILLPLDTCLIVIIIVVAIYSYFTCFAIFYAVKLIGNCLELFLLINEMEIVESGMNRSEQIEKRYYEYRIMALEKLNLSKGSEVKLADYQQTILQLINDDDTDKDTKALFFSMLNKQFKDD